MLVTITGADDHVDPDILITLSFIFPFVEWGILISEQRQGSLRYPTRGWIERLFARVRERHADGSFASHAARFSAHLCGADSRTVWDQRQRHWALGGPRGGDFARVQLNGVRIAQLGDAPPPTFAGEYILQARDDGPALADGALAVRALRAKGQRASILHDPSGGRGIEAPSWPTIPPGVAMGYAGGIRPETVEGVLEVLLRWENAPDWIDMESGVRTSINQFDAEKACRVLVLAGRTIERLASKSAPG